MNRGRRRGRVTHKNEGEEHEDGLSRRSIGENIDESRDRRIRIADRAGWTIERAHTETKNTRDER